MSVYGFLNETIENTNYLHRLAIYDSKFLDNIFVESFADFEAINEAIDFKKIKEKLSWKNIWEWIKGIFGKIGEAISKLAGRIKDFFTGKKKKETEAKLKALEEQIEDLKMENLDLNLDKKALENEVDDLTKEVDRLSKENDNYFNKWEKANKTATDMAHIITRKNAEISGLEADKRSLEKEKDEYGNQAAYAKAETEHYKNKYKAVIGAKAKVLKEATDNLDLYFSAYDVMNPDYHPIRIVRSGWFEEFATFFESYDKEGNLKHSNAPEDIVGYFDKFIEKNGAHLNIFDDNFAKLVGSDNDIKHGFYSFDRDGILKAIGKCKVTRKQKSKIESVHDAVKYAENWNSSIHGQASDINEMIMQFSDMNKRAVALLDRVVKQCSAENPDPGITKLQHFQEELNKFIRFINNQIQLLTIVSDQCAKTLKVIDTIAGASAVTAKAS